MKIITPEMTQEFNTKMFELRSSIRLIRSKSSDDVYEITTADKFIEYISLGLSNEFYNLLNNFFDKKGITISYNNTGTTIWAKYTK